MCVGTLLQQFSLARSKNPRFFVIQGVLNGSPLKIHIVYINSFGSPTFKLLLIDVISDLFKGSSFANLLNDL